MNKTKNTWLYAIATVGGGPVVKIGVTKNPKTRVKQVQTGSPFPIYVAHTVGPMTPYGARSLEKIIHEIFDEFRMTGEWFRLSPEEGVRLISQAWDAVTANG